MDLMTPELLEKLNKLIEMGQVEKFYQWKEWKYLRKKARERDHNECVDCKEEGDYGPAEATHHIKEVIHYPWLALSLDNLRCLCGKHHNIRHPEKLHIVKTKKIKISSERWD